MIRSIDAMNISRILMAGIFLALMLACAGLGGTPAPTLEPKNFGYCGAHLADLCVVSFGRDAFGDTVVNLFVPSGQYPTFHLNIVRNTGADVYKCISSKIDETSVYCTGSALNLEEGIVIQILADKDNLLLARGAFTVNAFLITTPRVGEAPTTEESGLGSGSNKTETPSPTQEEETPEPTSSTSYPNYP